MKTDLFVVCDAATVQSGKLNLLGTFDSITSKSLPVKLPSFAIAGIIRFNADEAGDHRVRIAICNADGQPIASPLDAKMRFSISEGRSSATQRFLCNVHNLMFDQFGDYTIQLAVDSIMLSDLPLFLAKRER
jgi:hypothetical protein